MGHKWQGFEFNYEFACSGGEVVCRHLDFHVEGYAPLGDEILHHRLEFHFALGG